MTDNSAWLSQNAGRPVKAPRRERLQDLIDSRPFWDSLAEFDDLPTDVVLHERVPLWSRGNRDPLTAEIYVPDGEGPYPLYLHLHGGGFCVSRAQNDRKWALEQCIYTARWFTAHADEWKGDPSRMVIEGGSAGAGLAAATLVSLGGLIEELDQGDLADVDVSFAAAVLFYGILDFTLLLLEPGSNVGSAELWNRAYLGPHFTTKLRHPLVSPVLAPNLGTWPPTYISCGMHDSLLPHSLALAKALSQTSIPTTLSVIEGANHGYAKRAHRVPGAEQELDRIRRWLDDKVPAGVLR
jgi:acetyl esterase